jgi:pimeloyl-ACP methyl ester carboxylesterase
VNNQSAKSNSIIYNITNRLINFQMERSGLNFHETQLENFKIKYWDSGGDKPVLLLLQAFTAESKFTWRRQVKELSKKYRLLLPNLLYFGGSTNSSPDYSVNEQVNAIDKLIQHLNIKSLFLCGASYGGIVAMELALLKTQLVKKLILIGVPIKYLTDDDRKPVYERFNVKGKLQLLVPENHQQAKKLLQIAYKNPPGVPTFIFKSIYENLYVPQAEDRRKLLTRLEKEQHIYDFKNYQFTIPVLLIWGEGDFMVPLHVGKKLKEHIGENAKLEIIPDTAHLPNLENSVAFNKRIMEFLNE